MKLKYNKQLVKTLFKISKEEINNYRYYLIAKIHFYNRSGLFSLDELLDLLHEEYNFKTLHHRPGNNRHKYKRKFRAQFKQSILFVQLSDGRFKYIPEKRINPDFTYSKTLLVYNSDLKARRTHLDACLMVLYSGNQFKSYQAIKNQSGYTIKRIQESIKRNVSKGRLKKINNLVFSNLLSYRLKKEATRVRAKLLHHHGIATPEPFKYKGRFYLLLYAANSYFSTDIVDKGVRANNHLTFVNKAKCWFKRLSRLFKKDCNLWLFQEENFNFEKYLNKYGFKHL